MSDDAPTHLVFVWTHAGYELREEQGELPELGANVEVEGTSWTVVKIAPSPLPNDFRTCAYLQG